MTRPSSLASALAMPGRSLSRLRGRLLSSLAGERATPARLGWAVALGVLIGTTPFYGFHLAICLVAATALRLSRPITYLAANVSLPWTAPLLVFGSVQLGSFLLEGHWLPISAEAFRLLDPWQFAAAWLIGSVALGSALGAPAGLATYLLMRAHRRRHPLPPDPAGEAMKRAGERFRAGGSKFVAGYVAGKLNNDPIYRRLAERGPFLDPILDIGCGYGQTLVLLAETQSGVRGTGVDWDEAKLTHARLAAADLPGLVFMTGDARGAGHEGAGTILLIDLLHYQPAQTQDEILRRAARSLAPGGVILVREVDASGGMCARISRWHERIGQALRFHRAATLCFRPAAQLADVLESEGLVASVTPASANTPFSNVLIEARRLDVARETL